LTEGPSGIIEKVEHINKQYVLTVAGEQYTLTKHPYVIADSADPSVWVGQTLSQSFVTSSASHEHGLQVEVGVTEPGLQLLVVADTPYITFEEEADTVQNSSTEFIENSLNRVESQPIEEEPQSTNIWLISGVIVVVLTAFAVIFLRKRK